MFLQTIQEVKFEDIILSKKQQQARRTNKLRHWLQYLSMLDQNKSFQSKNSIIQQLHKKFILREDFWLRQLNRIFQSSYSTTKKIQFAFLALEDGFYERVAKMLNQKIYECFIKQKIRVSFVVAKLQLLISQFNHRADFCSSFFQTLINIYQKQGNNKKIRQTYLRQIQMGFDNFDVVYEKYICWQKDQNEISQQSLKPLFIKSKSNWDLKIQFLQEHLPSILNLDQFDSTLFFDNQIFIKSALVFLQSMNSSRINESKYLNLLNILSNKKQKIWYLRRLALSQTHQLVEEYFNVLQQNSTEEEIIIQNFKNSFDWQNGHRYQELFLKYLVRRINKHMSQSQDQEYNNTWGEKVQYFRTQISQLIQKKRQNSQQEQKIRQNYYNFWIQVQTALVKSSDSVSTIFQSFFEWGTNQLLYLKYASYMTKLNDVKKARFIYNKTCQSYNYSQQSVNAYLSFVKIYGSLQQNQKLNKKLSQKKILKQKKEQQNRIKGNKQKLNRILSCEGKMPNKIKQNKQLTKEQLLSSAQSQIKQQANANRQKQIFLKSESISPSTKQFSQTNKLTQENEYCEIEQSHAPSFKRPSPAHSQQQFSQKPQQTQPKKKIHTDEKNTLFVKNIKKEWNENDIKNLLKYKNSVVQIRLVGRDDNRIGYIEYDSEQKATKQINQNKSDLSLFFSKPPSKSDECTLFMCNIPVKAIKNQIMSLIPTKFLSFVKDVRIKEKADKKMAYIEFQQQNVKQQVLNLLKQEKIKLFDKTVIVMNCQSDNMSRDKKGKTIFLKNLSFKCNADDIKKYFQQKGFQTIKEIFIPKEENNKPRGFAYVEFNSHEELEKALQMKKGIIFKRQFIIHKSDRAIKHETKINKEELNQTQSGSGHKSEKKSNSFFKNMF